MTTKPESTALKRLKTIHGELSAITSEMRAMDMPFSAYLVEMATLDVGERLAATRQARAR